MYSSYINIHTYIHVAEVTLPTAMMKALHGCHLHPTCAKNVPIKKKKKTTEHLFCATYVDIIATVTAYIK